MCTNFGTQFNRLKGMEVLEVTSREFREKQKAYFELADKGQRVIIKRGRKQSYILTPIASDDIRISPAMELKILRAMQASKDGRTRKVHSKEELHALLESL